MLKRITIIALATAMATQSMAAVQSVRGTNFTAPAHGIAVSEAGEMFVIAKHPPRNAPKRAPKPVGLSLRLAGGISITAAGPRTTTPTAEPIETIRTGRVEPTGIEVKLALRPEGVEARPVLVEAPSEACPPVTVHFAFGKSDLVSAEQEKLRAHLAVCPKNGAPLKVTGYTCSIGPQAFNESLALKRAEAVARWLRSNGYSVGGTEGVGEKDPITTEPGRQSENRRAVVAEDLKVEKK